MRSETPKRQNVNTSKHDDAETPKRQNVKTSKTENVEQVTGHEAPGRAPADAEAQRPGADHSEADDSAGRASALVAGLRLLLPGLGKVPGGASVAAVHWLVPGGLLIGLAYVGLYRASWRIFGEVAGVRLMPALAIWLLDVVLCGLPLLLGAARTVDRWGERGENPTASPSRLGQAGTIGLLVLLILKLVLWTALSPGIAGWPADWRRYFNFAYPRPVLRPLILAPMWGRWGLILAASIGRTAPAEGGPIAGLSGARSPAVVLGWFVPVLALTAVYCGRHGRWMIGCIIGLAVLGVTFLFAVVSARRFSGHTRYTVYAAALLSEASFLIFYLAACQRIYYY